ncbi:unnamed protein product [Peronospora destructor]|uniref:Sugar phosphate phosphatase n=1 Tax=Peronospora destructor TaxID=86335 RepID=A0AAV0T791_9STRA|nr:unnamed protein product [Peronospora destructor]
MCQDLCDTHFDCLDWFVTVWPTIVSDSSKEQSKRLLQLADDMVNNAVIPLPSEYPEQLTKSSTNAEWRLHVPPHTLLAEYYTTGVDPFYLSKVVELKEVTPWVLLQTAVGLSAQEEASLQSRHDQLKRFMKLCLWGNKADGCYKEITTHLKQKAQEAGDAKCSACNNSGTKLLLDLALADHLLAHGWHGKVTLNVKVEPMYVSDAIPADVIVDMQHETRTPAVQTLGDAREVEDSLGP